MSIFEKLDQWLKEVVIGWIEQSILGLNDYVNQQILSISSDVATSPEHWNADIWTKITAIVQQAIVPIAAIILTYVMCMEIIQLAIDKNNLNEIDLSALFMIIIKMFIAVVLVNNVYKITLGIFDAAAWAIGAASGEAAGELGSVIISETTKEPMINDPMITLGNLIALNLQVMFCNIFIWIMSWVIKIILLTRMLQIYLYISLGPIPVATFMNREWSSVGQNYLKSLFALAFQGFLIMVLVAIYASLAQNVGGTVSSTNPLQITGEIRGQLTELAIYTAVLCFSLFQTGAISKSVFNAH